jgi:hypothetical protein
VRTGRPPTPVRERLLARVQIDERTGCWLWTGVLHSTGYGQIGVPRGAGLPYMTRFVHRIAYETFVGQIPKGLTVDHLCSVRRCLNPEHLEPVTQAENNRRSARLQKNVCANGHPYDGVDSRGYRRCTICNRAKVRKWRRANRAHRAAYARDYRRRQREAVAA